MLRKLARDSQGRLIAIIMLSVIAIGTALLSLPISTIESVSFIDRFFTATTATCVCSQLTIPLDFFTPFGKAVILLLIQIGGIGLMTLSIIFMSIFVDLGLTTQLMAGKFLEMEGLSKAKHILRFIITSTLIIEAIGALIISIAAPEITTTAAIFHSVSSFCNAGFSLFPNQMLMFANNYTMLITTIALMLLGGLGFAVLYELFLYPFKKRKNSLSIHTKIVVISAAVLILIGTVALLTIQYGQLSINSLINSLFNAVSIRSTGFTTIPVINIIYPTYLIIMIMAFIGSAPGSTGSGVKTTSIFIAFAAVRTIITNQKNIALFGREVNSTQIIKILSILTLSISWVLFSTFVLLISEKAGFLETLFECVSAFCNLGLTVGLTPNLSILGKVITIMSMIIGRIGPVTLILTFAPKTTKTVNYPEEKLMLG